MSQLSTLIDLFYDDPHELGNFAEVADDDVPQPYQKLLAHRHHMTVTVEAHHQSPVDVRVLERKADSNHYARRILLARQSDGRVVQFGIMRVNFTFLGPEVQREIESETIPLGRVLIEHNVLREIEVISLWRVTPGPDLCHLFHLSRQQTTYGRTAIIHCNGEPAVELLEIVTPEK